MKNQEAFTKVWNHFVVKGGKQSMHGRDCRYRSPNGARCAVGVLIPDELYATDFEHTPIRDLLSEREIYVPDVEEKRKQLKKLLPRSWALLQDMQDAHDTEKKEWRDDSSKYGRIKTFQEWMRQELTDIAKKYRLKIPGKKARA